MNNILSFWLQRYADGRRDMLCEYSLIHRLSFASTEPQDKKNNKKRQISLV